MATRVLHVDMDAFFAAVEQAANPHLQGLPVVVGGGPGGRGVVTTASYECRPFGVHSGMSAAKAHKLCPQAIFVPVDGWHYSYVSHRLREVYEEFSPCVEAVSVDEAFLDVTGVAHLYGSETELGRRLKERVCAESGLTCSLGIAPNKLLAKLASSVFKPDGLTIWEREDLPHVIYDMPVERLSGVGPVTLKTFQECSLKTIGDLALANPSWLEKRFGSWARWLQRAVRGEQLSIMLPEDAQPEPKSVGHEMTFAHDLSDPLALTAIVNALASRVARRLRRYGLAGRTITLRYRYTDFTTRSKRTTLFHHSDETGEIFRTANELLSQTVDGKTPLRLLGVTVSNLAPTTGGVQASLFDEPAWLMRKSTDRAVDQIRDRFGERAIVSALAFGVPERSVI